MCSRVPARLVVNSTSFSLSFHYLNEKVLTSNLYTLVLYKAFYCIYCSFQWNFITGFSCCLLRVFICFSPTFSLAGMRIPVCWGTTKNRTEWPWKLSEAGVIKFVQWFKMFNILTSISIHFIYKCVSLLVGNYERTCETRITSFFKIIQK